MWPASSRCDWCCAAAKRFYLWLLLKKIIRTNGSHAIFSGFLKDRRAFFRQVVRSFERFKQIAVFVRCVFRPHSHWYYLFYGCLPNTCAFMRLSNVPRLFLSGIVRLAVQAALSHALWAAAANFTMLSLTGVTGATSEEWKLFGKYKYYEHFRDLFICVVVVARFYFHICTLFAGPSHFWLLPAVQRNMEKKKLACHRIDLCKATQVKRLD